MRYAFIKEHRHVWRVRLMGRVWEVSVSGFYDWCDRPASKRAKEDTDLTEKIGMFHCGSGCTYGSPRIYKAMKAAGHRIGEKRVARLMKRQGIQGKAKRKYKTTTPSIHERPRTEHLVKQTFTVTEPNKLWLSDITYIPTLEGWLYLAIILDAFSRKAIGWAFSDRLSDTLVLTALRMAKQRRTWRWFTLTDTQRGKFYPEGVRYGTKGKDRETLQ